MAHRGRLKFFSDGLILFPVFKAAKCNKLIFWMGATCTEITGLSKRSYDYLCENKAQSYA